MSLIAKFNFHLFEPLIGVCENFRSTEMNRPLLIMVKMQFTIIPFPIKFSDFDTGKSLLGAGGTYLFEMPLLQISCLL